MPSIDNPEPVVVENQPSTEAVKEVPVKNTEVGIIYPPPEVRSILQYY